MPKIMVVDDDEYIRELVATLLKNERFSVVDAVNGRDALTKADAENPDLYIIDVMMPQLDGFELCKLLRQYYGDRPILMLTAKSDISQKAIGFERGTDDYLTKPFESAELIMRVKALLRRYKIESAQVISVGAAIIDRESYSVTTGGEKTDIPMKEFELLWKLAASAGRTLARDAIIEDVWGYDFEGNERTLDVHINRLRERFPANKCGFKITTIRGLGYRLEVPE
ncbi:MAG: response regulator transcription factor [Oscillospiraceae bacterium]|jgi:DNA-binding response OmpR family regulator|nr:response regulator transcription factor [Oscillospiraceae bacterium]